MPTGGRAVLTDALLREELDELLSRHFGTKRRVVGLEQRPHPYRSSFLIHEVDLTLDDGSQLELILKDLSRHPLGAVSQAAKPAFMDDPLREVEVYERILGDGLGTATSYGAVVQPERDIVWLFLERVPGLRLTYFGEPETWQAVARWLAGMHTELRDVVPRLPRETAARLVRHDGDFYRRWLDRARAFVATRAIDRELRHRLDELTARYDDVVERLLALPSTIIHGEFYADNILVDEREHGRRVCPVDWEHAAIGPGLIDLATLVAGKWTPQEREALELAYRDASPAGNANGDALLAGLSCCRVHIALQWAGSATPAATSAKVEEWLGHAFDAADRLGL